MKIMLRNTAGQLFSVNVNSSDNMITYKSRLSEVPAQNVECNQNCKVEEKITNSSIKFSTRTLEQKVLNFQRCGDEDEEQITAQSSDFSKCLVPECGLMQRDNPNKHFFLPPSEERLLHWLLVCRRTDLEENIKQVQNEHFAVCEDHFIADHFVDNAKSSLKSYSIPTIFSTNNSNMFKSDEMYIEDEIWREPEIDIQEGEFSFCDDSILNEIEDVSQSEIMSQLCRLCASSVNDVVYIFSDTGQEQQIAKKINSCLPITVKNSDPLPKQLCTSCVAKLNLCHEFAESCIEAEDKLLRLSRKKYFRSHPLIPQNELKEENAYNQNIVVQKVKHFEKQSKISLSDCINIPSDNDNPSTKHEVFDCPLCTGGCMSVKHTNDISVVNFAEVGFGEYSECVSYDCTSLTDGYQNNSCTDSNSLWETDIVNTRECEKTVEGNEEVREEYLVSGWQNVIETEQLSGILHCRICSEELQNIEICLSHAESHFDSEFYPCNLCDLCFTSLRSFKGHFEKQHIEGAKSKVRGLKRLMCNLCGRRFNSERTRNRHTCGSSPRPFKCEKCGKSFLTELRLEFHQQVHQGGSSITCEHCGKMFSRENNLYDHVRLVHMGEKAHCCDQCGKTFQLKSRLIAHQRVHTGERPFECDVCGGKFYDKATLKGHRTTHLEVKPFQCEKCGRCFARKTLFKQHCASHANEERKRPRTYACRLCAGSSFASYAKLVDHRKDVHPEVEMNEVDTARASKPFKCDDCGKTFAYRVTLLAHRRNHTGELPFQCEFCSKRFSQKRSLILHRRTHTGEKPFVCVQCGKRFVQSAHLYSHMRLHTGEKPYACDVCGETFRLKDLRDAHQRKHTGERPFKCNVCNKAFRTSHSYYQHMWIHQGKKPYPCSYCGKAFRRSNGLKIHIRIHTGEKPHTCDVCGRSFAQKQDMKKHRNLHGTEKL